MSIRVKFAGGPADGVEHEYPYIERALPSLYWQREQPTAQAVYRRLGEAPDPATGLWSYEFSADRTAASPST